MRPIKSVGSIVERAVGVWLDNDDDDNDLVDGKVAARKSSPFTVGGERVE